MGECGISISETIGTVEPDKVTAFEVWLFDKNDVRTVTGVLMSEYAFNDLDLHAHLSDKGTPVLAEVDRTVCLETATLSLDVVITEMAYGTDDECPPSSFFEALAVELIVPSGAADGSPAWAEAQQQAEIIEQTLESLGAPARVVGVHRVPSATWFDVEPGTKVDQTGAQIEVEAGQIDALADDLALALVVPSLHIAPAAVGGATVRIGIPRASEPEEDDPRLDEAISLVRDANRASATLLQRRLRIGYARAARLIEAMEAYGIIGPDRGGSRGRKVL